MQQTQNDLYAEGGTEVWVSSTRAYRAASEAQWEGRRRTTMSSNGFAPSSISQYRGNYSTAPSLYYNTPIAPPPTQAKYRRSRRYAAIFLNLVSVAHVAMFVVALLLNKWTLVDLSINPLLGPGIDALEKIGATSSLKMSDRYQYWRLATSPFLGAGILHVAANISVIYTFGMFLATALDVLHLVLLYVMSGLAAVTVSANIGDTFITAAGSGPAFGYIGGSIALLLLRRRHFVNHLLSWALVTFSLAVNAFIGATPFVDNSGNTAGLVSGALGAAGMLLLKQRVLDTVCGERLLRVAAAVLLSLAAVIPILGIIGLNAGTPLGSCCDVWVCAPTPWWDCGAAQVWPSTCSLSASTSSRLSITCPRGEVYPLPASVGAGTNITASTLNALCVTYCTLKGYVPPSSADSPAASPGSHTALL
mmetsp:Transcript_23764/g.52133  ORF Transcript_23764/g.52133 Transcript_23764/m.52133 type:complete len:420 (-) Transcript_23764:529-1788(-)